MLKHIISLLAVIILVWFTPAETANAKPVGIEADISTDRIIVKYKESCALQKAFTKGKALPHIAGAYSIPVPEGENIETLLKTYQSRDDVEFAQPDYKRYVCALPDEASESGDPPPYNWGITRTSADTLSRRVSAKSMPVVAVVDSGIYAGHPLLRDKLLPGYDFANHDDDPDDDNGHGTHVAGIIAMAAGKQPVKILPVKVLDSDGEAYDSDIVDGILYAVERSASVINLSFGGPGSSPILEEAITVASKKGVLVVAAAGNSSVDAADFAPANIPYCITVSAINKQNTLAYFSNYGEVVDVSAPGQDIISSVPPFADTDGIADGYIFFSGTSMAAPYVSGIAALLRANNPEMSSATVENVIYQNCDDAGAPGKDKYYGNGIINFADYLISSVYHLKIVLPQPYSEHYNTLPVQCDFTFLEKGEVKFKIDDTVICTLDVSGRDSVSAVLDISKIAEGTHKLQTELIDCEGKVLYNSAEVAFTVVSSDSPPRPFPAKLNTNSMAFSAKKDGNFHIYLLDTGSGEETQLTYGQQQDYEPAWSADGENIAFVRAEAGQRNLYVLDLASGNEQCLLTGQIWNPAWAPDGKTIVFGSGPKGIRKIYTVDASGGSPRLLVNAGGDLDTPAFSPGGQNLAFTGNGELYIAVQDGREARLIPLQTGKKSFPAWSADGSKIYFLQASEQGDQDLCVVEPADSGYRVLAKSTPTYKYLFCHPSRHDSCLALIVSNNGVENIYLTDSSGCNPVRITNNSNSSELYTVARWIGNCPQDLRPNLDNLFDDYPVLGPVHSGTPLDHIFRIKFSSPVDSGSVNIDSIALYRYDRGLSVPISIAQVNEQEFKVTPSGLLLPGIQYWIVVKPSVKSRAGSLLKHGVVAKFITAN